MKLLILGQRGGSVGVEIVEILRRSYTRAPLTSLSRSFFVHPSKSIEFLMSTGREGGSGDPRSLSSGGCSGLWRSSPIPNSLSKFDELTERTTDADGISLSTVFLILIMHICRPSLQIGPKINREEKRTCPIFDIVRVGGGLWEREESFIRREKES